MLTIRCKKEGGKEKMSTVPVHNQKGSTMKTQLIRLTILLCLTILAAACGSSGGGGESPPPNPSCGSSGQPDCESSGCSSEQLGNCDTESDCTAANGFWDEETTTCSDTCQSSDSLMDTCFGTDGIVLADNTANGNLPDEAKATTIDSLGRVLVIVSERYEYAIRCYGQDGELDASFGEDGQVGLSGGIGEAITIDQHGNLLVVGQKDSDMAIWRLSASGVPDENFGDNGLVTHNNAVGAGADETEDRGMAVGIDSQGRILVTGYSNGGVTYNQDTGHWEGHQEDMVLWRYLADGRLDSSFGDLVQLGQSERKGYTVRHNDAGGAGRDYGYALAVDTNDRVVVTGKSCRPENGDAFAMVVWRFTANGVLDKGFGDPGPRLSRLGYAIYDGPGFVDEGRAVLVGMFGRIVVAGYGSNSGDSHRDMMLWRFTDQGILDTGFGEEGTGVVSQDNTAGGNYIDEAYAVTMDREGRLWIAGKSTRTGLHSSMVVWRFLMNGTLDERYGQQGALIYTPDDGIHEGAEGKAIAVNSDGQIFIVGSLFNQETRYIRRKQDTAIWRLSPRGVLDSSFGNNGMVGGDIGSSFAEDGLAMTVAGSGKIFITGSGHNGNDDDMAIWSYHADGTVNQEFGDNGAVNYDHVYSRDPHNYGMAIAPYGDSQIVVAGSSPITYYRGMTLWRYNLDGSLDDNFGEGGLVQNYDAVSTNTHRQFGQGVAVDSQGRILVAGYGYNADNNYDLVIWRYTAAGELDTSFGDLDGQSSRKGYTVAHGAAGGDGDDRGLALVIDSQDRVLVSGVSANGVERGSRDMVIWRYTEEGELDRSFGDTSGSGDRLGYVVFDGTVLNTSMSRYLSGEGRAISLDGQGRILVAGHCYVGSRAYDLVVWRYTEDGQLDTAFGHQDGDRRTGFTVFSSDNEDDVHERGYSIRADKQGRLLVSGSITRYSSNGYKTDMAIWRFSPDGIIDSLFADQGVALFADLAGGEGDSQANALAVDNDNGILVAGTGFNGTDDDMVLMRLLNN